jgi:acyl carrier protein
MTREELHAVVRSALKKVAPEADTGKLELDVDVREELDLDSMDFMNFIVALHEALGVDIAERDYPKYFTLKGCFAELERAVEPFSSPSGRTASGGPTPTKNERSS